MCVKKNNYGFCTYVRASNNNNKIFHYLCYVVVFVAKAVPSPRIRGHKSLHFDRS